MATDIINIQAELNRNIIDDDAEPALELETTSATGHAVKLVASTSGGAGADIDITGTGNAIDADVTGTGDAVDALSSGGKAAVLKSQATESAVLDVSHDTAIASPTVAPVLITTSAASGAVFEFNSPLISTASLSVVAGAFPVLMTGEDKVVYLVGYEVS